MSRKRNQLYSLERQILDQRLTPLTNYNEVMLIFQFQIAILKYFISMIVVKKVDIYEYSYIYYIYYVNIYSYNIQMYKIRSLSTLT